MKWGEGKQQQSLVTILYLSLISIHKIIYELYVNRTHFICTYISSRAFSGFQITK